MNNFLIKAFAENDIEYILSIDPDKLENTQDQKLVKCVHKFKDVCAQKILQTYGKDLMLYYMDLVCGYDKMKYDIETEEYMKKYHSKEYLYEIDPKQEREHEIKRILEKRGHGDLWDKKTITLQEIKDRMDGN